MYADYYFCHFNSNEIAKTSTVVLAIKLKRTPGRVVATISIPFKPLTELQETYFQVLDYARLVTSKTPEQHDFDKSIYDCINNGQSHSLYVEKYSTNADVWKAFVKFMEDKNN